MVTDAMYTSSGCMAIYVSSGVTLSREQQKQAFLAAQEEDPQLQLRFMHGDDVHIWGPGDQYQVLSAPGRPQALAAIMLSETRLCVVGQGKLPMPVSTGAEQQQNDGLSVRVLLRGTHDTIVAPLYLSGSSSGMWLGFATLLEGLMVHARFLHVQDGSWWSPLTDVCIYGWVDNTCWTLRDWSLICTDHISGSRASGLGCCVKPKCACRDLRATVAAGALLHSSTSQAVQCAAR